MTKKRISNAEKLQREPDDALVEVINQVVEVANRIGTVNHPYAYRFYDTGDEDVMLEVRGLKGEKRDNFHLYIVDKTGRRLAQGDPS